MKLALRRPWCTRSAIHSASLTSVFLPGTALICCALTTSPSKLPILQVTYRFPIHPRCDLRRDAYILSPAHQGVVPAPIRISLVVWLEGAICARSLVSEHLLLFSSFSLGVV